MIRPEMRVSELLEAHPQLLGVLIEASPAFAKLKNPLLRRTMPRLVTLAQAARIGGLEPGALIERLNRALGLEVAGEKASVGNESKLGTPPPDWLAAPVGFHLDVRPILAAGGEPFGAIMAAAREVAAGQRLCLEAPFEPLPLYRVMQRQGFVAWCEQLGPEHYRVHFLREREQEAKGRAARTLGEADWASYAAEVTIEANLEPPLPMMRVLEALARLEPGQRLRVHHVRRPVHLLARLAQDGHPYALRELGPGQVELLIEKRS
ncbi:DUF2249 domain-containing protein [Calidithermus timidus]|uniref:DUF2249 domain-containing protein n=1 Tax=Calidithermus timidus TaxID=307124 RepID=UPI00036CF92F